MDHKIYLVTMKSLQNDHVGERMKYMEAEALIPEGEPLPERSYTWLKREDDALRIQQWRDALKVRMDLLNSIGISIPPTKYGDDVSEYRRYSGYQDPTFACTGSQLLEIMDVDDTITVKSSAKLAADSYEGLISRLVSVAEKLENMEIPNPSEPPSHVYNEKCDVHISGNMLSTYNETLLLEDSCSDELQKALNKGWRIIACCPQSQRRPDYILGRYNPDLPIDGQAERRS